MDTTELQDYVTGFMNAHGGSSEHGHPFMHKNAWVRAITMISCSLSICGAALIIASFVCFKELRSVGRQILVNISAMDLGVALANLVGAAVYFDDHYHTKHNCSTTLSPLFPPKWRLEDSSVVNMSVMCPDSAIIEGLCITQAFFSHYFTVASILWTNSLSCYLYLRIVHNGMPNLAKYSLRFSYIFCYLVPLFLTVWLVLDDKLGYSPYESSGWCSIKLRDPNDPSKRDIFVSIFGYNLWIVLTFVLVPVLSLSTHFYVRYETKMKFTFHRVDRLSLALQNIDYKFLLIPVMFIVLRFWSFLGDVLNVFVAVQLPLWFASTLIILEGVGDSSQGFTNGVLFVLFTKKVRSKFLVAILCCGRSFTSSQRQIQHTIGSSSDERRYLLGHQNVGGKPAFSQSAEHTPPVTD